MLEYTIYLWPIAFELEFKHCCSLQCLIFSNSPGAVVNDTLELWEDKAFIYTHPTPLILPKRIIHTPKPIP